MKKNKESLKKKKIINPKPESFIKKHFSNIVSGLLITVLGGLIIYWLTNKQEDLHENSSKLNCTLVVNNIKGDSVNYSLKIKNIGKSMARKIRYRVVLDDYQYGQSEQISQNLSVDESLNLFPIPIVNPYFLKEDIFSLNIFLYYESFSEDDSIEHKNKFTFFVPKEQLFEGEYNPVNSIDSFEKIFTESQLDSLALVTKLKQNDGSISYAFYETSDNQLNYFFRFDSTALLYNPQNREMIFQKLFNDGNVLTIKKVVVKRDKNYHIVILNWINNKYSLYVNGDSSKDYHWQKTDQIEKR
ncbi:MAG TPA: hypothetical protein DHV28_12235 [Ignavibacteriales bacterium]|nr:hypothetical protein [Ignavibacteriales bacterium]